MSLDTRNFIPDLIKMGPDASSNLFKIEMSLASSSLLNNEDLRSISMRTTTFNAPNRDSASEDLPYQNVTVSVPAPGATITKVLEITVRLDSGYKAYSTLRKLQLIDSYGHFDKDEKKKIGSMRVTAYEPSNKSEDTYIPVYEWVFNDIYLLTISRLTYGYESSNNLTCNISLVWGTYTENPLN